MAIPGEENHPFSYRITVVSDAKSRRSKYDERETNLDCYRFTVYTRVGGGV